ncbi:MAG: hypothetical protein V4502_06265 [Pseudomonadota bacterium]
MAYLARIEPMESQRIAFPAFAEAASAKPDFSPLEWSIIRHARTDGLSTIREPGVFSRLFNWVIGRSGNRQLANEGLEALRRTAVLSWHFGFSIPGDDVAHFLSTGFTADQYELLVSSVRAAATGSNVHSITGEAIA